MSHVPMTHPEGMIANLETNWGYATFVQLTGGDILEGYGWQFRISKDQGLTWSKPTQRFDTTGLPVTCCGLVNLTGGGIGCASNGYYGKDDGTKILHHGQIFFWRSEDGGETWEPPIAVTQPGIHNKLRSDTLLRTRSGRLIIPMGMWFGQKVAAAGLSDMQCDAADHSNIPFVGLLHNNQWVSNSAHYHDPTFSVATVFYSDDEGLTWEQTRSNYMPIVLEFSGPYHWSDEPTVTEIQPGHLLMFYRTLLGRLFQAWSYDNGETWTRPQPTQLAADNSPAKLVTLPNTGHLLCVWNQHNEDEVRRGLTRLRLSSAISRTGGSVWEFFQNVESILEQTYTPPGSIHVVRPENTYHVAGTGSPVHDAKFIQRAPEGFGRWSYPSVLVCKDHVLIHHSYTKYDPQARPVPPAYGSRLKILPLKWFYGDAGPDMDNPNIQNAFRPAAP